eukprot:6188047-Pleurochrysis_carterae.AAC.2
MFYLNAGPQDAACQTESSLFDPPTRPEKEIHHYQHSHSSEELVRQVQASGCSVVTPATAQAEMMDFIQDNMEQRTAMDTYQTRSWYLKFVQEPMLAPMFKKFKRTSPET